MLAIATGASPAMALSAACTTLNSKSGTSFYTQTFAASAFEAGETVTVSFTDNGGDPKTVPEIQSGQIRLNSSDSATVFYRYSTYTGAAGSYSGSHNSIDTDGLSITINTKSYLDSVMIVCAGPAAALNPPVANAASATVVADTSDNPVTLNITGGTPTTVGIGTQASHGTATASGTSITYTPTAGYTGSDSFTYTAENADGVSAAATVSVTVNPAVPTLTGVSPASGSTAGGTVLTITGTNLTGATGVTIGGTAATGVNVISATSITATTPARAAGAVNVAVTTPGGSDVLVNSFTYVALNPPVANAASATVVADTSDNPVTLNITGGTPTTVGIGTQASHGTATASGTSITYTPTTGYTGSDSFTYTAENADGVSAAATVSVTVNPAVPTLTGVSPASGSTAGGTVLTITGANLTGATGVTIGGTAATGVNVISATSITATTPAHAAGAVNVAVTTPGGVATIANGFTFQAQTVTIAPASGTIPDGTIGIAYSQALSVTGAAGPYVFAVSGSVPPGLTVDTASGLISGTPATVGNYSFTVTATGGNGATASVNYSATIASPRTAIVFTTPSGALKEAMAGEDYSQQITATGGTGSLLYSLASGSLPAGMVLNVSTGELTGPVAADANSGAYAFSIEAHDANGSSAAAGYTLTVNPRSVTVTDKVVDITDGSSPPDVYLNRGATGGPFVRADTTFVEPANAGTVTIIQGQLAQSGPVVTPVGWYLQFTPNPAYSGQVRIGFRLTSALGVSNTGTVTYNIGYDADKVESDVDRLVQGFVRTRQSMISSTIYVPGLLERRQMAEATGPVTALMTPSENGMTASFSTSLAQIETARDRANGGSGGYSSPFNIWINGAFLAHNDENINGGKWGSFAMLNLGVDYLLTSKALLGLSFHHDYMTDPTDEDAELKGNGWLAGPYASFEIGKGVFWNASLLYGGSSNSIDTQFWDGTFTTRRWMADTSIDGQLDLGGDTTLRPKLRVVYFSEDVKDYAVKNSMGDTVNIDGFNTEQFRVSLGAEIARSFTLDSEAKLAPKFGITGGFSGLDGTGAFASMRAGMSLQTADSWMLDASLLFNVEAGGEKSVGARLGARKSF
ncbi:IPT/TIG domain-containing protein [Rhizobium sp. AN5]|uniref:IPT/TIG domain-containing protein n=1 Tax=Rhizobium sp. AN5 TaxID=1855304 RepID=UPI0015CBE9CB|nr:IPT/TIG domain-containing protein [Rhizobium sp. AN5]